MSLPFCQLSLFCASYVIWQRIFSSVNAIWLFALTRRDLTTKNNSFLNQNLERNPELIRPHFCPTGFLTQLEINLNLEMEINLSHT